MLDALFFAKTPALFTKLYPECLWRVDTQKKILYLTFDDGPVAEITPFVLDLLKRYKARATFFCVGKNIEANPEIFQRILHEGHAVGNHTFDHLSGWKFTNQIYFENIERCTALLKDHGKIKKENPQPLLFRPPYGKLKPMQYLRLKSKYGIVMWDILTFDYDKSKRKQTVLNTVLKHAVPGSVIVFHDSVKAQPRLEYALPKVLEHYSAKGYKFERL